MVTGRPHVKLHAHRITGREETAPAHVVSAGMAVVPHDDELSGAVSGDGGTGGFPAIDMELGAGGNLRVKAGRGQHEQDGRQKQFPASHQECLHEWKSGPG
jgi:hypothetical protein